MVNEYYSEGSSQFGFYIVSTQAGHLSAACYVDSASHAKLCIIDDQQLQVINAPTLYFYHIDDLLRYVSNKTAGCSTDQRKFSCLLGSMVADSRLVAPTRAV